VAILGFAANSQAIERTAYAIDAYGNLVSGVLPTSSSWMHLSTIADFDNFLVGSTMDSDGRMLSMFAETDELVSINLATLEYQVLHTLAVDIWEFDDLVSGPSGELLLILHGYYGGTSSLFEIDTETGGLTLLAEFDQEFTTIEYHQGAYYAGTYTQFWRIDPATFEATLIRDFNPQNSGCFDVNGLSSVESTLWVGYACGTAFPNPSTTAYIGTIDPETGFLAPHAMLDGIGSFQEIPHTLQIFERITPIPTLSPTGVVVLVVLLGLVGIIAIRRL